MKYLPLLALVLSLFTEPAHAQTGETQATIEAQPTPVELELRIIDHQRRMAGSLYLPSVILGVQGTVLLVLGYVLHDAAPGYGGGFEMMITSGPLLIGHILTMAIGMGVDFGAGSRHRKLVAAHPELAIALAPGPGDAGLGLALHF